MQVNFSDEQYQKKWENAYLIVKSATASEALTWLHTPAYRVM